MANDNDFFGDDTSEEDEKNLDMFLDKANQEPIKQETQEESVAHAHMNPSESYEEKLESLQPVTDAFPTKESALLSIAQQYLDESKFDTNEEFDATAQQLSVELGERLNDAQPREGAYASSFDALPLPDELGEEYQGKLKPTRTSAGEIYSPKSDKMVERAKLSINKAFDTEQEKLEQEQEAKGVPDELRVLATPSSDVGGFSLRPNVEKRIAFENKPSIMSTLTGNKYLGMGADSLKRYAEAGKEGGSLSFNLGAKGFKTLRDQQMIASAFNVSTSVESVKGDVASAQIDKFKSNAEPIQQPVAFDTDAAKSQVEMFEASKVGEGVSKEDIQKAITGELVDYNTEHTQLEKVETPVVPDVPFESTEDKVSYSSVMSTLQREDRLEEKESEQNKSAYREALSSGDDESISSTSSALSESDKEFEDKVYADQLKADKVRVDDEVANYKISQAVKDGDVEAINKAVGESESLFKTDPKVQVAIQKAQDVSSRNEAKEQAQSDKEDDAVDLDLRRLEASDAASRGDVATVESIIEQGGFSPSQGIKLERAAQEEASAKASDEANLSEAVKDGMTKFAKERYPEEEDKGLTKSERVEAKKQAISNEQQDVRDNRDALAVTSGLLDSKSLSGFTDKALGSARDSSRRNLDRDIKDGGDGGGMFGSKAVNLVMEVVNIAKDVAMAAYRATRASNEFVGQSLDVGADSTQEYYAQIHAGTKFGQSDEQSRRNVNRVETMQSDFSIGEASGLASMVTGFRGLITPEEAANLRTDQLQEVSYQRAMDNDITEQQYNALARQAGMEGWSRIQGLTEDQRAEVVSDTSDRSFKGAQQQETLVANIATANLTVENLRLDAVAQESLLDAGSTGTRESDVEKLDKLQGVYQESFDRIDELGTDKALSSLDPFGWFYSDEEKDKIDSDLNVEYDLRGDIRKATSEIESGLGDKMYQDLNSSSFKSTVNQVNADSPQVQEVKVVVTNSLDVTKSNETTSTSSVFVDDMEQDSSSTIVNHS